MNTNDTELASAIDSYVDNNHATIEANDTGGSVYREMIGQWLDSRMTPVDGEALSCEIK